MSAHERLERIAAFERAIAWLQARQDVEISGYVADAEQVAAAAVPSPRRPGAGPSGAFDTPEHASRSATAEIQLMLHLTGATMLARLERARLLHQDPVLAPTATLAHAGLLTAPKTRKILDGTAGLDPPQAARLQAAVLPKAPTQTTGQLGAAISRFLVSLTDHELPVRRRDRATRARGVTVQPDTDGMAVLRAFLPAAAATGIYAVLDETARRRPCSGGPDLRTMDQRRADALTDLVLHPTGHVSEGSAAPTAQHPHSRLPVPTVGATVRPARRLSPPTTTPADARPRRRAHPASSRVRPARAMSPPPRPEYPAPHPTQPEYPAPHPTQPEYPAPHPTQPEYPAPHPTQPEYPAPHPTQPEYPASHPTRPGYPASRPPRPASGSRRPPRSRCGST